MATLHPFRALRPSRDNAVRVAEPPYDVVSTREARELAQGNADSYLHVSRPEIDLPEGTDDHADAVYARGTHNLSDFRERGVLRAFHRAGRPLADRAAALAMLIAGVALVLVPVGLRNEAVGGNFLITTSQAGSNFYIGNHEGATGRYLPICPGRETYEFERKDATDLAEAALGRELTPREVSDYWRDEAFAWIRGHPGDWTALLARKTLLTWNALELPDTESLQPHRDHAAILRILGALLGFGVVAPWAIVGIPKAFGNISITAAAITATTKKLIALFISHLLC